MSNDPRQYGDERAKVIPSVDGTDFRQYERRVLLFVSTTRVAPEREAGKLLGDWKDVHLTRVKEYRTWKHRLVLRICLIT